MIKVYVLHDNPSSGQSEPPLVDSQRISSSGESRECGGGQGQLSHGGR